MANDLILPFKPFTLDEVHAITGLDRRFLDYWTAEPNRGKVFGPNSVGPMAPNAGGPRYGDVRGGAGILPLQTGEDGITRGLTWQQTFAAYVGKRYMDEGADAERAEATVEYLGKVSKDWMEAEIAQGNTFPVPGCMIARPGQPAVSGMFVRPPDSALAKRVVLDLLLGEFVERLERVFPSYRKVPVGGLGSTKHNLLPSEN